jgi:PAS domain S-box-containing protein
MPTFHASPLASDHPHARRGRTLLERLRACPSVVPGALLALLFVWASAVAALLDSRAEHEQVAQRQADLLARLVEEHTTRHLLDHEAATLRTAQRMRNALSVLGPDTDSLPRTAWRLVSDGARAHPALQLDLVSAEGVVVAGSSNATWTAPDAPNRPAARVSSDLASILNLSALEGRAAPNAAAARHWQLVVGDDLTVATRSDGQSTAPSHRLVRAWPVRGDTADGAESRNSARLWLVASIDPLLLAAEHALVIGDAQWRSAVIDAQHRVIAASGTTALPAGRRFAEHPALLAQTNGSGPGPSDTVPIRVSLAGEPSIGALRAVAVAPLTVIVDVPWTAVDGAWQETMQRVIAAALVATIVIVAVGFTLQHQRTQRDAAVAASIEAGERAARSEADLRALVNGLPQWMFRTDAQGRITFVNRQWTPLTGHDEAWPIGRPLADLVHPSDALAVHNLFDDGHSTAPETTSAETTVPATRLVRVQTADGHARDVELMVAPLWLNGQMSYAGFGVDVTERETIRRQATAQYRLTEQLIDAIPQPVFLTNPAGELLLANRAWGRWLGLRAGRQVSGREDLSLVNRVLGLGLDEVLREGRKSWPIDLPAGGARVRETLMTKVPLHQDGAVAVGVIGTLIDVTEFREAERATERALRAAEAAVDARTEFVANVSHELRTPLQSIIGFAELGRDRSDPGSRPHAMFNRIHDSGQRMLKLVQDLLDVSRPETVGVRVELRALPLASALRDVVDELHSLAASRGLQLHTSIEPALADRRAPLDPLRFGQVVRNVMANAIRFAPAGSAIRIALRDADGVAVTSVSDQGPGIPEDELETIFEPFVQSSRTRDGSGGTGLGLAICRRIMKEHDGFIQATNQADGGAVFEIGLRWAADQKNSTLAPQALAAVEAGAGAGAGDREGAVATTDAA